MAKKCVLFSGSDDKVDSCVVDLEGGKRQRLVYSETEELRQEERSFAVRYLRSQEVKLTSAAAVLPTSCLYIG